MNNLIGAPVSEHLPFETQINQNILSSVKAGVPAPISVPDVKNLMEVPASVHQQNETLIAPYLHTFAQTGVPASLPIPVQSGSYARVSVISPILKILVSSQFCSASKSVAISESVSVVSVEPVSEALETEVLPCAGSGQVGIRNESNKASSYSMNLLDSVEGIQAQDNQSEYLLKLLLITLPGIK